MRSTASPPQFLISHFYFLIHKAYRAQSRNLYNAKHCFATTIQHSTFQIHNFNNYPSALLCKAPPLTRGGIKRLGLDDAKRYSYGHDVFEEMVVSKIFSEQYYNNTEADKFFSQFHTSLRTRKLFRNWLTNFAGIKEHQDIIFKLYESKNIDVIWRNEVLLAVISTETLKEVYCKCLYFYNKFDYLHLAMFPFVSF